MKMLEFTDDRILIWINNFMSLLAALEIFVVTYQFFEILSPI